LDACPLRTNFSLLQCGHKTVIVTMLTLPACFFDGLTLPHQPLVIHYQKGRFLGSSSFLVKRFQPVKLQTLKRSRQAAGF
jgi:hypothetical protein